MRSSPTWFARGISHRESPCPWSRRRTDHQKLRCERSLAWPALVPQEEHPMPFGYVQRETKTPRCVTYLRRMASAISEPDCRCLRSGAKAHPPTATVGLWSGRRRERSVRVLGKLREHSCCRRRVDRDRAQKCLPRSLENPRPGGLGLPGPKV